MAKVQVSDAEVTLSILKSERERVARRIRETLVEVEKMAAQVETGHPLPSDVPTEDVTIQRARLLRDLADAHERAGVIAGYLTQAVAMAARTLAHDAMVDGVQAALAAKKAKG